MVNGLVSSDTPATPFPSEPEPPSYSPAVPFLLPWGLEPFPFPFDIYIYIFFLLSPGSLWKMFLTVYLPWELSAWSPDSTMVLSLQGARGTGKENGH